MVSKLFVTDNLFCCWSNWHWARIIFLRSALPLIWGDLHAGLLVSHVRWLWIQFWLLLCYVCITTVHGVLYQSYAVLCDGFWWRRIHNSFEAISMLCSKLSCHADKGFSLQEQTQVWKKKIFVQLIVVVACDLLDLSSTLWKKKSLLCL